MARCDTCPYARWNSSSVTTVWCKKKRKVVKVGRLRHLFAAAKHIRRKATPPISSRISVGEVVKFVEGRGK